MTYVKYNLTRYEKKRDDVARIVIAKILVKVFRKGLELLFEQEELINEREISNYFYAN